MTVRHGTPARSGTPAKDQIAASAQPTSEATAHGGRQRPDDRVQRARISWYGAALIFLMLTIAAGWELWRLLLLAVTLD